MPNIALYTAGDIGVIKDVPPEEVDPRGWSDCRNVRFRDGKAMRPTMDSPILFQAPALGTPYQVVSVQSGTATYWAYSSLNKLFASDGLTHVEVTRVTGGNYTVNRNDLWHGGTISQIPVITNGIDVPQMWKSPGMGSKFEDLVDWPATDRCKCIKPFKSFLVAMNVIRSGTPYAHLVKWSHPAIPGNVPEVAGAGSAWDAASPTLLAGEVELVDEFPGGIRDGGGLRDTFIIYKDNATWGMQFTGDFNVFRFFPIFLQGGIMSTHCFTEISEGAAHFVATGDDFIIHDGQNARSVLDRRIRAFILRTMPTTVQDACFCISKPATAEVWFCFPEEAGEWPTLAAIYNWESDTCSIRELPSQGISFMALGPIAASSEPWNPDTQAWDSDTTQWDKALYSAHDLRLLGCSPDDTVHPFWHIEDGFTWGTGYMERTGLALLGQDRVTNQLRADNEAMKLIDRVWMKGMGSKFYVAIGAQELAGSLVEWQEPEQEFIPGVTKYIDFRPIQGRFMAIRISWNPFSEDPGNGPTSIQGYDMNVEVLGRQ